MVGSKVEGRRSKVKGQNTGVGWRRVYGASYESKWAWHILRSHSYFLEQSCLNETLLNRTCNSRKVAFAFVALSSLNTLVFRRDIDWSLLLFPLTLTKLLITSLALVLLLARGLPVIPFQRSA